MSIKFYKPITPSRRTLILKTYGYLRKKPLLVNKLSSIVKKTGRNHSGKITVYHKGSGVKQRYRRIGYSNEKLDLRCIVLSLERDPYRTANIASAFCTVTKEFFYMLAPEHLKIGDSIFLNSSTLRLGCQACLSLMPVGTFVFNISPTSTGLGTFARSAGSFGTIIEQELGYCLIKLPSGAIKKKSSNYYAFIGIPSNPDHFLTNLGKAGRARWLSKRPTVRGVAMNPVDHPHGGGEGKTSGGRPSVTPWGKSIKSKTF